jgi:hypothetical protein
MPLPIVGMHFRPPAKALTDSLPAGIALFAKREPENEYDPNAIRVLVKSSEIMGISDPTGAITAKLSSALADYGFSLSDIADAECWHLGYIPKEIAKVIAPRLEIEVEYEGTLTLSPIGKPMIEVEFPRSEEPSNDL